MSARGQVAEGLCNVVVTYLRKYSTDMGMYNDELNWTGFWSLNTFVFCMLEKIVLQHSKLLL